MSHRHARVLAAGAAAVLAVTVGVPAALAAGGWTVQPGGMISLTSGRFILKDTPTGTMIRCVSSSFSGTLKSGSGHSGTAVGSITTGSTRGCGILGMFTITPGDVPWHLNLTSYNAAKGVAQGTISGIHLTLGGSGCNAMIDGTGATVGDGRVVFRYTDGTGQFTMLTTGGNLHFYNVSAGCNGLVRTGDPATLSTTYTVTPKQVITSP